MNDIDIDRHNFKRIIIVAYRLPYKISVVNDRRELVQNAGGLVSAMLSLSQFMHDPSNAGSAEKIVWVGQSEYTKSDFEELSGPADLFNIHPVALPQEINKQYYEGFCNDTLWPLFHYFPMYSVFKESYFEAYTEANRLFNEVTN